jgi:hypothetical protein
MKYFLIFIFFLAANFGYTQTYLPKNGVKPNELSCNFTYSHLKGANRPSAYVSFSDNYNEISLNAVCGETGPDGSSYDWCVRYLDNGNFIDIAYISFKFENQKQLLKVKLLKNKYSNMHLKHLSVMGGIFVKKS